MITVTERAKRALKAILIAIGGEPDEGLRLLPEPAGSFVVALSTELSGDTVIEHEEYKVLLIGVEYFKILDGKTIDCQNTENGVVLFVQ